MVLITSNKQQRLMLLTYAQKVTPAELESGRAEIAVLLAELPADVRLLADMTALESMDPACMTEIGRAMDTFNQHGVGLIIRVIPDPSKDIGMSIMSVFHYPQRPRMITSRTMAEALHQLSLWP